MPKEVLRIRKATDNLAMMLKKEAAKSEAECYMESLVSNHKTAVEKGEPTEHHLRHTKCDMVFAGSLTTTTTMRGLINRLIHHPQV